MSDFVSPLVSFSTFLSGSGSDGNPFSFRLSFSASLSVRCFPYFSTTT
jgi:hypothetical protein